MKTGLGCVNLYVTKNKKTLRIKPSLIAEKKRETNKGKNFVFFNNCANINTPYIF